MVSLILRSAHVIRFTCMVADDVSYFKFLGCRLLFTLCLEKTSESCVHSESIFVTSTGDKRTTGVMEIDLVSNRAVLPDRKRKGIALSHPSLRCAELKDVTAWSLRGSSSFTAVLESMDLRAIARGSPDGKKSKMKQSRDVDNRSYGRKKGDMLRYFMLQLILLNMYKNEVTSAFTQVESSEKIRRMIDSGGWLEFKHRSRPYFAQTPIFMRQKFFEVLNNTRPYCIVDHSSLLRRFYLPIATFSRSIAFSSIRCAAFKNPLLPPKSLSTPQKYGLITLKSSSLCRSDFVDQTLEAGKCVVDWLESEAHNITHSFDNHKELLKNKYGAALELRDDAVLHLDDMLILFQAFAIIMVVPLIFLIVERERNPSFLRKTRSHSRREDKEMFPRQLYASKVVTKVVDGPV